MVTVASNGAGVGVASGDGVALGAGLGSTGVAVGAGLGVTRLASGAHPVTKMPTARAMKTI
jgi:hypothetical protein